MATIAKRVSDLEAWKSAHLTNHVLTGHPTDAKAHGHPHVPSAADALTAAEVASVRTLLAAAGSGGGVTPVPNDPPPPSSDITAPTVSGVAIGSITTSGATITCTTSEAATAWVQHGIDQLFGSTTSPTASGTSHSIAITGYPAQVKVYFRIIAQDTAGNIRQDATRNFTTASVVIPPGPEPPGSEQDVSNVAELRAAIDNLNLSTVIINPGTYHPGSDIAADYFLPPLARPSTNPLLVRALNIPADPADAHDVIFTSRMYFRNRRGTYTTWQGISFEGISPNQTGIVVFGAYGEPGPGHVTFLDTRFVGNTAVSGANSHFWYLSDGSSHDIVLERYYAEGSGHTGFTGFHAYHDPLGNAVTLRDAVIRNVYRGILAYGNLTNFLAEDVDIANCGQAVDMKRVGGILRRVNISDGTPAGSIQGPITLDNSPDMPVPTP